MLVIEIESRREAQGTWKWGSVSEGLLYDPCVARSWRQRYEPMWSEGKATKCGRRGWRKRERIPHSQKDKFCLDPTRAVSDVVFPTVDTQTLHRQTNSQRFALLPSKRHFKIRRTSHFRAGIKPSATAPAPSNQISLLRFL